MYISLVRINYTNDVTNVWKDYIWKIDVKIGDIIFSLESNKILQKIETNVSVNMKETYNKMLEDTNWVNN